MTMAEKFNDPFEDFYIALGVLPSASSDEIRQAYVERIKDVHPDRFQQASNIERQRAEETSRLLNRAKETLLNPSDRRRYNERYHARFNDDAPDDNDFENKREFYRKDRLGVFSGARPVGFLVVAISTIYILGASIGLVGRAVMTKGIVKVADAKQTVELSAPTHDWRTEFSIDGFGLSEQDETAIITASGNLYKKSPMQNIESRLSRLNIKGNANKIVVSENRVAVSSDSSLVVYSLDGATLAVLNGHHGKITCMAFSPDGVHLCSASEDRTIKIWNLRTGAAERTFAASNKIVESVAFTPDGIYVAFNDDRWLKLWSWRDGRVRRLAQHRDKILYVACCNDWAASASIGGEVKQTHRTTGAVKNVAQESGLVTSMTYCSNGRLLATSNADGRVKIYNASTARLVQTIEAHHGRVSDIQFSSDSKSLFSAGADSTIKLWTLSIDLIQIFTNKTN